MGFPIPEAGKLVLMLGHDGQLVPIEETAQGQNPSLRHGPDPAPFAIQTAIAAVQAPIDGGAILAINRSGLLHLTVQNRLVQLHQVEGLATEFSGRSVAQAWIWNGKAMFLLHRNEVFEHEALRTPAARIIAARMDGFIVLPGFEVADGLIDQEERDLFGAPYAVFPRANDHWLVQFRLAGPERTRTAFATWNPDRNQLAPMERYSYETAVSPAPMSEAPVALRFTAENLGGPLILDAAMPDGSLQTWLQGSADTRLAVRAVVSNETTAISLASDGRLVMVAGNTIHVSDINRPVPQAYFRDLALLEGFIIAVWEEDLFPDIGRSGLVILDATRLIPGTHQFPMQPGQSPGQ